MGSLEEAEHGPKPSAQLKQDKRASYAQISDLIEEEDAEDAVEQGHTDEALQAIRKKMKLMKLYGKESKRRQSAANEDQ